MGAHTLDPQIATEEGLSHINMLDFDLYIINPAFGVLGSVEFAARAQVRRAG
jgi:hypothetical protein